MKNRQYTSSGEVPQKKRTNRKCTSARSLNQGSPNNVNEQDLDTEYREQKDSQ